MRPLPSIHGALAFLRIQIVATFAGLVAVNIAAWVWAWSLFSSQPTLLAAASLAYVFGLRHAVDADHIAAIDNVVRKLMQDGQKPFAVGLYFSLGHSTVVVLATVAIAAGSMALQAESLAAFRSISGAIGTGVSAVFLLVIGLANLFILRRVWASFQRARSGETVTSDDLDTILSVHGFLSRILVLCSARCPRVGTCTRSVCFLGLASTRPPRSACWELRPHRLRRGFRSGRS